MADASGILNNTILIPTSGSLSSLPNSTIGNDLQAYNKLYSMGIGSGKQPVPNGSFRVFFNAGGSSVPMKYCEGLMLLEITRNVEARHTGGNGNYVVKMPGSMNYSPVMFNHFYCDNDVFMDWLINGADHGGIQKANIEIKIGQEMDHMVYTLRDAFPISWALGTMDIDLTGLVLQREVLKYTISEDQILVENLTVAYGKMELSHETSSWGS